MVVETNINASLLAFVIICYTCSCVPYNAADRMSYLPDIQAQAPVLGGRDPS